MEQQDRADALFSKILIFLTMLMLIVVFAVFMMGAPLAARDRNEPDAPVYDPSDTTVAAQPVPHEGYLPYSDDATALMDDSRLDAEFAVLMDMDRGYVVASRLGDSRIYPASMTKIMTLIVCCERLTDMQQTVSVSSEAVEAAYIEGASCAGFAPGERVTVLDLLYGVALPSGADATGTLARLVAGSEAAFVELMNAKAAELGLVATHFVNASGLHHNEHYSTAREIAAIMAYAMDNELCRRVLSAVSYTSNPTEQHPEGITMYSTGFSRMAATKFGSAQIVATKTGYTDEARFCFASYAETDSGGRYVLITANGNDRYAPIYDCKYAYETFAK